MGASYLFTVEVISRRTKSPHELQCVDIQMPEYTKTNLSLLTIALDPSPGLLAAFYHRLFLLISEGDTSPKQPGLLSDWGQFYAYLLQIASLSCLWGCPLDWRPILQPGLDLFLCTRSQDSPGRGSNSVRLSCSTWCSILRQQHSESEMAVGPYWA